MLRLLTAPAAGQRRYAAPCRAPTRLAAAEPLAIVGIDDWAWRRDHRHGAIGCDLDRRRVVALLADREQATTKAWPRQHRGISIVSRDRGGGCGEAAARGLPHAIQVADRWHPGPADDNGPRSPRQGRRRDRRRRRADVPGLADARRLVERFGALIRTKAIGWTEQTRTSQVAPLARDVAKHAAAIAEPWSNGQTEGQVDRLKIIKRQMHGRP